MPKSVLFVIPCGRLAMSGVFRVLDYLPFLKEDGISCRVVSYSSPALYKWLYLKGGVESKRVVILTDYLGLFYTLFKMAYVLLVAGRYDFIFIGKSTPPKRWIRILKKINPRIIYDIDDAVFIEAPERTRFIVESAFRVSAGSHFLLDYVQPVNKRVILLPTPVPLQYFPLHERLGASGENTLINIGWVGTTTNLKYLAVLQKPLSKLAERYPGLLQFTLIGHIEQLGELKSVFSGVELKLLPPIDPKAIASAIAEFDIGVMPLFNGDLEKGKCASKALLYMAAQVPVVCSAVGENNYVIDDGVNGYLAGNDEDWYVKLSALIDDPQLRVSMGRLGRKTVEEKYATARTYRILRDEVFCRLIY